MADLEPGESKSHGGIRVVADLTAVPAPSEANDGNDQVVLNLGIDGSPRGWWMLDAAGNWQPNGPIVLGRDPLTATTT